MPTDPHQSDSAPPVAGSDVTDAPPVPARNRKLPIAIGAGLLGAVVIAGALVVGLNASSVRFVEPPPDITTVDFANTPITGPDGTEYRLSDGKALKPGMEDYEVGYHLSDGPVFADVDGDGQLEAATLMTWQPAAGANTFAVYVWRWDGERAVHMATQAESRYHGSLSELVAVEGGFEVERMTHEEVTGTSVTETVTIGLAGDDVVRLNPLGAVQSCGHGSKSARVTPGIVPRVAPRDDAVPVGVEMSTVVWMGNSDGDPDGDGWALVQMATSTGPVACGWIPADKLTP